MHSLFPAYLNGCRVLGGFLYVDVDEQARQNILALQEQNKVSTGVEVKGGNVISLLRRLSAGAVAQLSDGVASQRS